MPAARGRRSETPPLGTWVPGVRSPSEAPTNLAGGAYAQWIVATRLLYHVHDPSAQPSRMQGISSRARLNCNPPARDPASPPGPARRPAGARGLGPIRARLKVCGSFAASGMDSDLEAFSHNPAGGSFAALPCRTAAKTNYLNQRFLSY